MAQQPDLVQLGVDSTTERTGTFSRIQAQSICPVISAGIY